MKIIDWEFYGMDYEMSKKFKNYLLEMDETLYVSESIGSMSSFESDMLVKNATALYSIADLLKEKFPDLIKGFDPLIILQAHKEF